MHTGVTNQEIPQPDHYMNLLVRDDGPRAPRQTVNRRKPVPRTISTRSTIGFFHLIELIDAADARVCQHQRTTLQMHVAGLLVSRHCRCQTDAGTTLTRCVHLGGATQSVHDASSEVVTISRVLMSENTRQQRELGDE